jgi:peptidyl-prolyl cis-trans isomerase A (cyclophilin A)
MNDTPPHGETGMSHRHLVTPLTLALVVVAICPTHATETEGAFVPPDNLQEGWYARIETSMGRIVARLLPEQAPQSVAYFTAMAEGRLEWFDPSAGEVQKGPYYDGIKVHRASAGLSFEAGDPHGTGNDAPSLYIALEGTGPVNFSKPGRLGMTKAPTFISAVQFFVTASSQPRLTGTYPCFGIVVSGLNVVTNISQVKTYRSHRPIDPPVIERIRIFSVGDPPPLPEPQPYTPKLHRLEARPETEIRNGP